MAETINVLHLSTHNENCGIAIFQEGIVDAMGNEEKINNVFFNISPNKLKVLTGPALDQALEQLFSQLKDFDILHIQHEYSFYNNDQLARIVAGAKSMHKKILFTLHTPPHSLGESMLLKPAKGLHPRSWVHAYRASKTQKIFYETHIQPLLSADRIIVLSNVAKDSFASFGVPADKITVVALPVPKVDTSNTTQIIAEKLHKQPGDVILSTVGFIAETKGITAAIKSLTFLPDNYKLAIIGGSHPTGQNDKFYDKACDLITTLGLRERVYISGYVADDSVRDGMIRETDICIYAYDRKYYDYVSSAALMNAVANAIPIVAYKTYTFEEVNQDVPFINFCQSANYYELARQVTSVDIAKSTELTKEYAEKHTVETQAYLFAQAYLDLVA